jgi:nitrite reductase/ring-hydroxylating ferredoxin subunit
MKHLIQFITLFMLLSVGSCKDGTPYNIPYVPVSFSVYPNGLDSDLGVSRYKYFIRVGYRGIVVYRPGMDEFLAYDRACTFDSQNLKAIIAVDATGVVATCPVCGSQYLLTDGYPFKGPAKNPLMKYQTTWDGFKVYISN